MPVFARSAYAKNNTVPRLLRRAKNERLKLLVTHTEADIAKAVVRHSVFSRFIKRSVDIIVSSLGLVFLSPLFLWVAWMERRDGGPIFFRQQRIGKDGKPFTCYKFRSMHEDAETHLSGYLAANPHAAEEWRRFQKLKNDVRITDFGRLIRRASVDELPQLFNVLKGDMSLVGPRPIISGQEVYYGKDFIYYKSVRPGITGPWQVSGRNTLTFSKRVLLECRYARNWSLWMDIVILIKTVPALLRNETY
jgi:undecaprenyl-phosphate galactose phosphotransferase